MRLWLRGDRERSLKDEDQTLQHSVLGFWATAGGAVPTSAPTGHPVKFPGLLMEPRSAHR